MNKEEIVPIEIFVEQIKDLRKVSFCCAHCNKIMTAVAYPYSYDKENSEVTSIAICPNCNHENYFAD